MGFLSDQVTVALAFNDNHIIYYHMDLQWSTGLEWTYITNLDCLVVQCWVSATFYLLTQLTKTEVHVYEVF